MCFLVLQLVNGFYFKHSIFLNEGNYMGRVEKLMVRMVLSDVSQHFPEPVDLLSDDSISTYGDGLYQVLNELEAQQLVKRLESGHFTVGDAYTNF
ncbi:hypothetical protein CWB73_13825 [Pseudoalteromonas phenolica]|uniref:Uncharacterized protein n=2 Tax=Pseudoalteromonas phenolica TaxID=161398 RepID=A0A5S3YRI6_9GAMM|nr:hypothetical protein CWB73_13825 [Pseudoalteromonas phenolica]